MNSNPPASPASLPATTLLFRGESATVKLHNGSSLSVRIWCVAVRHLLDIIDLFSAGREAELIARCVQIVQSSEDPAKPAEYLPLGFDAIDSLTDESHALLVERITALNFSRAISNAERQIARGQELLPISRRIAETLINPLKKEMTSLISSLASAASSTAGKTPP